MRFCQSCFPVSRSEALMTKTMMAAVVSILLCGPALGEEGSTDQIRAYKPEPRAYQMALDALQLQREEILFAAFAGWDAAGAKWFGYPTFWVNRLNLPGEELGVTPDAIGRDLTDVVRFVKTPR